MHHLPIMKLATGHSVQPHPSAPPALPLKTIITDMW